MALQQPEHSELDHIEEFESKDCKKTFFTTTTTR